MRPGETDLVVEENGAESVVRVRCAVDAQTGIALERLVGSVIAGGAQGVALDLGDCPLLDTSGVRTLIRIRRRADGARVPLRFARCSAPAERVLRRMHLDGVLGLPAAIRSESPYRRSRYHRFEIREPIHVWDGLLHRAGCTAGMSPEGLVLELPGPVRPFEVLRLEMALPDTGQRYRFSARVVHCRPGDPSFVEAEFLSLDPEMRLWLQSRTPGLAAPAPAPPNRTP